VKLVRALIDGCIVIGSATERGFVPLSSPTEHLSMAAALALPSEGLLAAERTGRVSEAPIQYLAPVDSDRRIFCVGVNYRAHATEASRADAYPTIFLRTHASVVGHRTPIRRPNASDEFDYEGELALVIGNPGRDISEDKALSHVAGYTAFNDGSIRNYQKHSLTAGKNFDTTGSCGPWIVTADEIPDPANLALTTTVNGEVLQHANTGDMIYSLPKIIAYVSAIAELQTGDVISTGTPAGVGAFRDPKRWLVPGDILEISIDGVGILRNVVEQAA
jgi:2-keto-4-pentenoate hydratase/2-oxohepta-3-ene-1,7-dioic acid hydratase in catechol pathway